MKKLFVAIVCLSVLGSCMSPYRVEEPSEQRVFPSSTATVTTFSMPLLLNQATPEPSPTVTASVTPTITPTPYGLPDLTIPYTYIIDYDGTCPWGSPGTITVWVENIGTNHAGPFIAAVFSEETQFDGLFAGESEALIYHFNSGPVGGIYAEADRQNQVMESNESNNVMQIMMTPPPPCGTPVSP